MVASEEEKMNARKKAVAEMEAADRKKDNDKQKK